MLLLYSFFIIERAKRHELRIFEMRFIQKNLKAFLLYAIRGIKGDMQAGNKCCQDRDA